MAVTIKEIAKLANVSRATVDKVLNNRPGVKQATKDKIKRIIEEVHYQPNLVGKALVLSKDPVKVGIILTPVYIPFVQVLLKGIEKAKKEFEPFGFEVIVKMLTSLEPAEMLGILMELENENISGIALLPINDVQVIGKVNQLKNSGISILTFNSRLDSIRGFRYIGQDHVKAGMVAAGLMEKMLPVGGKIGVIISSKTLSCHPDRLSGFQTRIATCHNPIRIMEVSENQDKKEEAFKIALGYFNKYPDLDGFYLSGSGSSGVRSAISLAQPIKHIKIISHDLVPETEELLQEGILDFVIDQDPWQQGYEIVRELFNHLIKKIIPKHYILQIPIKIETKETIIK